MDSLVQDLLNDALKSTPGSRQNITSLHQFSLTEKSHFQQLFAPSIAISWLAPGQAKIRVPSCNPFQDIKAPAHTLCVELCFMLLSCDTNTSTLRNRVLHTLQIPYSYRHLPSQEFDLHYSEGPSQLSMIAVSLRYSLKPGKQLPLNEELQWMPAMIACGMIDL
jgi:hypothetical protein